MKEIYRQKEEVISEREIGLNNQELYLLRLVMHNYQTIEITEFLEIQIDHYFYMINSIKSKLKCNTWYQVIIKCFKNGTLKQEDFIDEIIKKEAVIYSEVLADYLMNSDVALAYIAKLVKEFIVKCDNKLRDNNKENFSRTERDYLDLKFSGKDEEYVKKRLNRSVKEVDSLQEEILNKLSTNNWYSAFKKAFHLKIISKPDQLNLHIDVEATNTASKMISFYTFKNMKIKEKQLAVYHELLRYYTTIEFKFLEQADL